nr:putative integron gene cassette protein [uncultured bacterium]CAP47905.1 putative integron gene cassette protein [uncultured bacterium]
MARLPKHPANINRTPSLKDKAQMEGSSRHGAVPDGKDNHNFNQLLPRYPDQKRAARCPFLQNLSPYYGTFLRTALADAFPAIRRAQVCVRPLRWNGEFFLPGCGSFYLAKAREFF